MKYRMIGTVDQNGYCGRIDILKLEDGDEFDPKSDESVSLDDETSLMCIGEITTLNNAGPLRMRLNDNVRISLNRDTELEKPADPVFTSESATSREELDPSLMVKITQPVVHSFILGGLDDPIPDRNKVGLWDLAKSRLLKFSVDWPTLTDFITCMNTICDPDLYIPVVSDTMHWQEIYNAITYRTEMIVCVLYGEGTCTKNLDRMIVYVDRARNNEPISQVFHNAAKCFHRLLKDYHCWPTPMEEGSKVMKVRVILN